jgi:N-acetylmuramoyl-L-alanine amidase
MNINDSKVTNVKITKNDETNQTTLTFTTKEQFNYEVITRESENDTTITLFKEALPKDQLVVIDPGHGGTDPGAVYGGINEKDLNLDIAKRLNELLKSKNIKTYMTREDDVFVGLYERAYIANDMKATLFVSIHNNAYYTKYKGTETLYYPQVTSSSGFNGKRFAQIVQDELIKALGTHNRGIVERPNLVVLKATKMPAILAEIAFMTNSEDLANLKSEEFRQKAAQALCDSIIKALGEV